MGLQFKKIKTDFDDVFLIEREIFQDKRGEFSKTFNSDMFKEFNINSNIAEAIYSISKKNVLRGMHYQRFPFAHSKIVHVIEGEILDVVLDIEVKSNKRNYGKYYSKILSKENKLSLYIPEGYAHGFLVLSDYAIVSYLTSTVYNAKFDEVIRYDSFSFNWPKSKELILSEKDNNAKRFEELNL